MLMIEELGGRVQKEIERVAFTLATWKMTNSPMTCYKKENNNGKARYRPIVKKLKPNYSISIFTCNNWNEYIRRDTKTDNFTNTILYLIEKLDPDQVRVSVYQNESRNYRLAGQVDYLIVLKGQVHDTKNATEPDVSKAQKQTPIEYTKLKQAYNELKNEYNKTFNELTLIKLEGTKTERELRDLLKKKENEMTMFMAEVKKSLDDLRENYNKILSEKQVLEKELIFYKKIYKPNTDGI